MLAVENSGVGGGVAALPQPDKVPVEKRIDNARKLAADNPESVASVVKTWVAEDG